MPLDTAGSVTRQPSANLLQPWNAAQLQLNDQASAYLRSVGSRFVQKIYATTVTPVMGSSVVVNVPIQPVGLITKFIAEVETTITNPGGGNLLTRGSFGPFSQLSSIQYTDPQTNQRISTPGWHLACVNARRHRRVVGAACTTDSPTGFGATLSPIAAPATIAAGAAKVARAMFEIPLSLGRNSLKGGVFAGAVFATQSLQLTIGASLVTTGTDPLEAVYTGAAVAPNQPTLSTKVTVYQEYWDQFPLQLLNALSPDLSTIYEIKQTAFSSLVANMDNYVRYTNLRQFLSTVLAYDNGGVLNAGTDITGFKLQSANQLIEWERDVYLQSYITRNHYGEDFPAGVYIFDHAERPIITAAEGNTVLSVNPSDVQPGAVMMVGWEDLAVSAVLASAPSLTGNAGA